MRVGVNPIHALQLNTHFMNEQRKGAEKITNKNIHDVRFDDSCEVLRVSRGFEMKSSQFLLVFALFFMFQNAWADAFRWKGIFIAGDDSIENFDNGRTDLSKLMSRLTDMDSVHFTSTRSLISKNAHPATLENIGSVFNSTAIGTGEGCFIHMTSHGAKNKGFYLSLSGMMNPDQFAKLVNKRCGNLPTVILISACYSGQFITGSLTGPNRIIMTAAIKDRPSFGCSADTRYTYWDSCLLSEIPSSRTWLEVSKRVQASIQLKERLEEFPSSYPQAFFGSNTLNWLVRQ
jgi:hypothetical protein